MRVLLIEDDNSTAKSIELALAAEGIMCDIAQTGQEGIDLGMIYYRNHPLTNNKDESITFAKRWILAKTFDLIPRI